MSRLRLSGVYGLPEAISEQLSACWKRVSLVSRFFTSWARFKLLYTLLEPGYLPVN